MSYDSSFYCPMPTGTNEELLDDSGIFRDRLQLPWRWSAQGIEELGEVSLFFWTTTPKILLTAQGILGVLVPEPNFCKLVSTLSTLVGPGQEVKLAGQMFKLLSQEQRRRSQEGREAAFRTQASTCHVPSALPAALIAADPRRTVLLHSSPTARGRRNVSLLSMPPKEPHTEPGLASEHAAFAARGQGQEAFLSRGLLPLWQPPPAGKVL